MKKFILLASLLASSSSTYAMDPQIGEGDIVLSNPQGQRVRKISLDPKNPTVDLRLNPAKGETLWFEGDKWITIPGYPQPFNVDGEIEMTLSPIAYPGDCLRVQLGLHAYNLSHMDDFVEKALIRSSKHPIGSLSQESLILLFDPLLPKIGLAQTCDFKRW